MARGGHRPNAGRKNGSKSKTTVERELLAERIMAEQKQQPGRKLAKEVLDDFMHLFMGLAAQHQPLPQGVVDPTGAQRDEDKFVRYANMAREFARDLVRYQSPTMGMVKLSIEPRFDGPAGDTAAAIAAAVPGQTQQLTPSQAYRLLRDSDLIDIEPSAPTPKPTKKAANG